MNIIDVIILLILLVGILWGVIKGFISQAISVISLLLGAWLAYTFSKPLGVSLAESCNVKLEVVNLIVFVLIFVAVVLVLHFVGKLLEKTIRLVMLGWLNRLLGGAIALVVYGIVVGILLIAFDTINGLVGAVSEEYLASSLLYEPLQNFVYVVFPYFKEILF